MKMFSLLLSITLFLSPVQPQSEWSEWGRWSSCSRTCGGGITFQERNCSANNCVGENRIYRSCNIQDCPNGGDYRKEQCAAYNAKAYLEKFYNWLPYLGASDNPCALNCMPKNEFFYETFKEKVIDGTRCDDETYDMCADGVCKKAGCDLILGSDAKEDKCRVCNGNGNNCKTIQNIYEGKKKGMGYVDILVIPAGATNIFIREATLSNNYLALKNSSHSFILNGNRKITGSYKYQGPGTTLKYKRSKKEESIFMLGPTTDNLFLSLLSMGEYISISYEYSVPKSQKIIEKLIKYSWQVDQYGECNKKCNGGKKSRKVHCIRGHDNVEVDNIRCDMSLKPEEITICNEQHCPPRWFVGSWSPCSLSCGEGRQVRRVHCEKETLNGIEMIDEILCRGDKAINQRKCIVLAECPKWTIGYWSKCSTTCGGGNRIRTVQCVEINNNVIGNDKCTEHNRPRDQETCNEIPCGVRWVNGEWSACRPSCGKGMRTRPVYCASSTEIKKRYPDYMCNEKDKPQSTKLCSSPQSCPPMWYGSSWSKCTASCGKGMQMRNVFCGVKESEGTNYLQILSNIRCKYLNQLNKIQVCTIKPCHTQWIVSSWKPCSTTCGVGKRLRNVKCFADSEEDKSEKSCDGKRKPPTEDICNLVECATHGINTAKPIIELPKVAPTQFTPLISTKNSIQPTTRNPTRRRVTTRTSTRLTVPRTTERILRVKATETAVRFTRKTTTLSKLIFPTSETGKVDDNSIEGKSMPAVIVQGPTNDEAVVGSDITLPCEATGNPKPDIFWLKGNLDVSVFGQRFQVFPNGHLKITAVQEVDEDVYTCVANNVISRRSQPAYLQVTTRPYVDITLGYTVKEGEEARIQCKANGRPRPTVVWYKNGNILQVQRNDRMVVSDQQISIKSVKLEDQGKYKCKAINKNGETSGHMMLDVLPDEKTRLHDIMNGNCQDNGNYENCAMAAMLDSYCDQPYYQKVCCKTCREKNKDHLGGL